MSDGFHKCHNKEAAEDNNYPTLHTVRDESCCHFRARSPDDPATTWNRKQPGRSTDKRGKVKDPAAQRRGKASKRKGKKGEDEIGKHVVKRIGGEAWIRRHDRDVQFHGNALAGHHVEVKRYAKFGMEKHCVQAEGDAATHGLSRWIVAWRPDGQTRWRISTDLDDYLSDMRELEGRRYCDAEDERKAIERETGVLD